MHTLTLEFASFQELSDFVNSKNGASAQVVEMKNITAPKKDEPVDSKTPPVPEEKPANADAPKGESEADIRARLRAKAMKANTIEANLEANRKALAGYGAPSITLLDPIHFEAFEKHLDALPTDK